MNTLAILSEFFRTYNQFMEKKSTNIEFGSRLHSARVACGMTLQETADAIHIGLRAYQHYEAGTRTPSLDGLRDISKVLNVSVDWLLGLSDNC